MSDYIVGKNPCIKCQAKGGDRSGNNFHFYGEGLGGHCFSCGYTVPSDAYKEEHGINEDEGKEVMSRERLSKEQNEEIKGYTTTKGREWRGIRDDTNVYFGVRYEIDAETGKPCKQYVPTTIDSKLVGYKTRVFPKDFTNPVGVVGKECDMIGQFRFPSQNHTVLIVGGEVDFLSAYQMLRDSQIARGKEQYDPVAVVSPTVGETGCVKQVAGQYEFFNRFSKVVLMLDNDSAGAEATEKLVKVLPKGKVFIGKMRYKDPNEYLVKGKENEFVADFYNARKYSPAGLHQSDELYAAAIEYAQMERLSMPPFLRKLEDMLGGGVPRGYIVMIGAASSIGKTTLVNECVIHWVMNTNENIGVLSLEATAGEYASSLLSRYSQIKFANIKDSTERVKLLKSEKVSSAADELFKRPDGSPRFVLCDDRGDTLQAIEEKIIEMVSSMGITVLVIDVLSDLMAGLSISEQESHMAFQKKIVKEYNVTLINITHIRKATGGAQAGSRGAEVTEEQFQGSSSLFKSAGINIGLSRDKMNEDEFERNCTKVSLLKNRACGTTGPAGEIYYDNSTHTLFDKDEWLEKNGPKDF